MRSCNCSLYVAVVEHGKASAVLREAKKHGVRGGTIVYGKGTSPSHILHFLEVYEIKREVLMMVVPQELDLKIHRELTKKFRFDGKNRGFSFSIPLAGLMGTHIPTFEEEIEEGSGDLDFDYEAIFVVVERGKGEDIIDYATSAGARGATIIAARGSGIHEKETLFNITIEPEKEIVMMLVNKENSDQIAKKIDEEVNLDDPGAGILFILPVSRTSGLLK